MFNKKRLVISLICGALLGIICIFGVGIRLGFGGNELFILATWYNRVIMGLVIGLAGGMTIIEGKLNTLLRGLILGFMVSLALFLSTALRDPLGFMAGLAYGMIIDHLASKYSK
jgi:hypothetical protein